MKNRRLLIILYWIFTLLMCGLFLFSAQMYFLKTEMVQGFFNSLGFPAWLVLPLGLAKVLGVMAILSDRSKLLSEWAYAGFLFDVLIATTAHHIAGHGLIGLSFWGIFLVLGSRIFWKYRK